MRRIVSLVALTIAVAGPLGPSTAAFAAALDAKAIQIVANTFDFLYRKPAADSKVVVFHGAADMAAVRSSFATMSVSEGAAGDVAGAFAVFVNTGEEARSARGINGGVLTIGGDVACVTAGACLIAVETQPKVTIYVSRAVAQAAGVEFEPNFKMLVTEK